MKYVVDDELAGTRLDVAINGLLDNVNRSLVQKLIQRSAVSVDGNSVKSGYNLKLGQVIEVDTGLLEPKDIAKIEIPIIFEDDDCLVLDKPAGILTHSKGAFNDEPTVATYISDKISKELVGDRAGIVHRLDRGTSGLIICAKNADAAKWLQKQFSTRKVKKTYVAVVKGIPKEQKAVIDMPIERNPKKPQSFRVGPNGKSALTAYEVQKTNKGKSLIVLKPTTGRTHQLRVHLTSIGCPIIGDELYGGPKADRLYLHAKELELTLPSRERKVFKSSVPLEFDKVV